MRCLTLANALVQRGHRVRFLSRQLPVHCRKMLAGGKYEFRALTNTADEEGVGDLAHAAWLGTSQARDAAETRAMLSDATWDLLVVDHYALDSRWEAEMRERAARIMAIDDLADREHDCDVLLDQNAHADEDTRYGGKVPGRCELLLGPRFALLRDEFRQAREGAGPRNGRVRRVLVFFGGVDADDYTGQAVDALERLGRNDLEVDVVIGEQYPLREALQTRCARLGFGCHVQVAGIAKLMAAADFAIGAGGSSTWERCCVGLPTLAIAIAENQRRLIEEAALGGLLYAPAVDGPVRDSLDLHLHAVLENPALLELISRRGLEVVDGLGVQRVVRVLDRGALTVREANAEDAEALFCWRNHESVRSVSRNKERIEWLDHDKWLRTVLLDRDRLLLIGEDPDGPVGVVRFELRDGGAEVSIHLVPERARAGIGSELLRVAEAWLTGRRRDVYEIRAEVLGSNARSHRLFQKAGYVASSSVYVKRVLGS